MGDAGGAPAVQVLDLVKHFGEVRAVDGISFEAAPGEVFGLLGHNGAGKSTTIRVLTGRARPTSGRAVVLGHDVPAEFDRIRARVNLVADVPNLYARATARENLELFCRLYALPGSRADAALEQVGLTAVAGRKVKTFSSGMRQRLLLARALLNTPKVLFLDEPTRGLDPQAARDLHELVGGLAASGTTVLLTTHDMHEADALCDRVAFLADGRIAALDTPRALKLSVAGPPEVDVLRDDGGEERLRLDDAVQAARLEELVGAGRVRAVHSREPSLADVFIALAGRALHDAGTEEPRS